MRKSISKAVNKLVYPIKMSTISIWKLSTQNANAFQKRKKNNPQKDNHEDANNSGRAHTPLIKVSFKFQRIFENKNVETQNSTIFNVHYNPRFYHQIQVASLGKSNWHLKWKSYIH